MFQYKRRCFHCNAPRPIDTKSGNVEAEAAGPRGTEGLRPLLVEFVEQRGEGRGVTADAAVLGALVDCFGLHGDAEAAAAAGVCRFPLEALRLLRRPQQRVLVGVATPARSLLALSTESPHKNVCTIALRCWPPTRSGSSPSRTSGGLPRTAGYSWLRCRRWRRSASASRGARRPSLRRSGGRCTTKGRRCWRAVRRGGCCTSVRETPALGPLGTR
eukprot:COSAG01_NODE_3686_length_5796_cov_13.667720_4_plen_216_part_00